MREGSILVVEDDDFQRRQVERILTRDGYCILTAASGDEAIRVLEQQRVGIVLTDRKMPGMDGTELLQYIRHNYPEILVAIITAYPEGVEDHKPDAVLTKPYMTQQLIDLLQNIVRPRDD